MGKVAYWRTLLQAEAEEIPEKKLLWGHGQKEKSSSDVKQSIIGSPNELRPLPVALSQDPIFRAGVLSRLTQLWQSSLTLRWDIQVYIQKPFWCRVSDKVTKCNRKILGLVQQALAGVKVPYQTVIVLLWTHLLVQLLSTQYSSIISIFVLLITIFTHVTECCSDPWSRTQ